MKDQYVGDIGDFEKYSVLRAFQRSVDLPLVVCWMMTDPDATGEGAKTEYLANPRRYRHLEPHVFDRLEELVSRGSRSTQVVEAAGVLDDATFVRQRLEVGIASRRAMFDELARAVDGRPSIVFFDPDIGVAGQNIRKGGKRSSMYLFDDEIGEAFSAGHSLVIYQHFPREQRPAFLARTFDRLRSLCDPTAQFALYSPRVAFLVLTQADVANALAATGGQLALRWSPLLTLATEDGMASVGVAVRKSADEIHLVVPGYPPTKNEAKSLLSDGHGQFSRVRLLLERAQEAIEFGAASFGEARIGIELVVAGPADAPSDATNYLGGIGDVLQDKTRRGALEHLGSLAAVALFTDDRQVREVIYREERAAEPRYTLRLWRLNQPRRRRSRPPPEALSANFSAHGE